MNTPEQKQQSGGTSLFFGTSVALIIVVVVELVIQSLVVLQFSRINAGTSSDLSELYLTVATAFTVQLLVIAAAAFIVISRQFRSIAPRIRLVSLCFLAAPALIGIINAAMLLGFSGGQSSATTSGLFFESFYAVLAFVVGILGYLGSAGVAGILLYGIYKKIKSTK